MQVCGLTRHPHGIGLTDGDKGYAFLAGIVSWSRAPFPVQVQAVSSQDINPQGDSIYAQQPV
jgi:hypothetical protein